MVLYLVTGLSCVAVLVACAAASPAGAGSHRRSAARRRRLVAHHPTHVNGHDVHERLVDGGLAPDQARFVTAKAAERGIPPFTLWLWLERFDAETLAIAVAADLSHAELLDHIGAGTVPDLEGLTVLAAANGLAPAGASSRRPDGEAVVDPGTAAGRRTSLPLVLEPGSWAVLPSARRAPRRGAGHLAA